MVQWRRDYFKREKRELDLILVHMQVKQLCSKSLKIGLTIRLTQCVNYRSWVKPHFLPFPLGMCLQNSSAFGFHKSWSLILWIKICNNPTKQHTFLVSERGKETGTKATPSKLETADKMLLLISQRYLVISFPGIISKNMLKYLTIYIYFALFAVPGMCCTYIITFVKQYVLTTFLVKTGVEASHIISPAKLD